MNEGMVYGSYYLKFALLIDTCRMFEFHVFFNDKFVGSKLLNGNIFKKDDINKPF